MVERFIREFEIDIDKAPISGHQDQDVVHTYFYDESFKNTWVEFHNKHATLRVLSAAANLAQNRNECDREAKRVGSRALEVRLAWTERSGELANWVCRLLVNRLDVIGRYTPYGGSVAWPFPDDRVPGAVVDLRNILAERHFKATVSSERKDIVGLYATSPDNTCRWAAIDLDCHDDDPPGTREANLKAASAWKDKLEQIGFDPLLEDTDGRGGLHLVIISDEPVPAPGLFDFIQDTISDYEDYGLTKAPETFPSSSHLSGKGIGKFVRLPGKHHSRDHWTRIWDDGEWLEGNAAIDKMLEHQGDPFVALIGGPGGWFEIGAERELQRQQTVELRRQQRAAQCDSFPCDSAAASALESAVLAIPNAGTGTHYDNWLHVGMGIKSKLGEAGFDLWDRWSKQSSKYDPSTMQTTWAAISEDGGITAGTIFHMAKEAGWKWTNFSLIEFDETPDQITAALFPNAHKCSAPVFNFPEAERLAEQERRESCLHPGRKMLKHLTVLGVLQGMFTRCRDCPGCNAYRTRIARELCESMTAESETCLTSLVTEKEWETISRFVRRHHGWHTRTPAANGMLRIMTNVERDGFTRVSREEANAINAKAIEDYVASGDTRYLTTSRRGRWLYRDQDKNQCLKKDAYDRSADDGKSWERMPEPQWKDAGKFGTGWKQLLKETKEEFPECKVSTIQTADVEVKRAWSIVLPRSWAKEQFDDWEEKMKSASEFTHMAGQELLSNNNYTCRNSDTDALGLEQFDDDFHVRRGRRRRRAG